MKIEITGKHLDITPGIRAHVETHCKKLEPFFKDKTPPQVHVVVTVEKARQKAEFVVSWREHTLTAKETDKDLYQAVNKAIEKLEKQCRRLKEKVVERKHSAQKAALIAPEPDGAVVAAAPLPPRIIIADSNNLKPMTPEEAILVMSGESSQFLVFRDTESENLSIIYKRADGNYGLIQP